MIRSILNTLFCVGVLWAPTGVSAQQPFASKNSEDLLREVIIELRTIRQTLDHSLLRQSELLIAADQVKLAHQLLAASTERLAGAHGQVALAIAGITQAQRGLDDLEAQMNRATDPEQRLGIEHQIKEQHSIIAEYQQHEGELREAETRCRRDVEEAQSTMNRASTNLSAVTAKIEQETHARGT